MAPAPVLEVNLRPLTTGELIDQGFTLYRRHFAGLLLLALLSQGGPLMMQVLANVFHLAPTRDELFTLGLAQVAAKLGGLFLLLAAAQIVGFSFATVMTFYVSDIYLGRVPSVGASFRRFAGRLVGVAWTCLLTRFFYLIALVFPLLAEAVLVFWFELSPPQSFAGYAVYFSVCIVLVIGSLVPLLVVAMRLMVTVPVLALEGLSGLRACRRSSALVRYDPGLGFFYWGETRLSLLLLPLFVIQVMTASLTSLPLIVAQANEFIHQGTVTPLANSSDVVLVASQILTYLTGALILPLYSIAVLLFYYDVRIRSEGFDLEFMARRLEAQT